MYPSGTKEGKYPLERGGVAVKGSQQVMRLSSQQLKHYTPTPCSLVQERKNTNLKPENKSEVEITFQPLHIYQSQEPAVCDPANSYIIWSEASYIRSWDRGPIKNHV